MSSGDIAVLGVVLLLVTGAVLTLIRSHLLGKCSCGCKNCDCGCGKVIDIEDRKN